MWPDRFGQRPQGGDHQKWPEIITALAAIGTFAYSSTQETSPWLYLIPATLTVATLILLLRSLGLLDKVQAIRWTARRNKLARSVSADYLRLVSKRAVVFREILRILRDAEWVGEGSKPRMANYSFENLHNEIVGVAEKMGRINSIRELELISSRFFDFVDLFNHEFLEMYADALRSGRAKLRYDYQGRSLRQYKEQYDRFLEEYTDFCERFNEKARHNYLRAVHRIPPPFD